MDTRTAFIPAAALPSPAGAAALPLLATAIAGPDTTPAAALAPAEQLTLMRGQAVTLRPDACLLQVEAGRLWLTRAGDPDDHFLSAGDSIDLTGQERVVIECDRTPAAQLRVWHAGAAGEAGEAR